MKLKHKITDIYQGDSEYGAIIRITKPLKEKNIPQEEQEDFFIEQGEALGLALLEALPAATVASMASYVYGVLERTLNQNVKEEDVK